MSANELSIFMVSLVIGIGIGAFGAIAFLPARAEDAEASEKRGVHSVEVYQRFMAACPAEQQRQVAAMMLQSSEADYVASEAEVTVLRDRLKTLRAAVMADFPDLVKE